MTTGDMFKNAAVMKATLIFISFTVFSFGNMTVYLLVGLLILLLGCFLAFKQGAAMGHEACSVSASLNRIAQSADKAESIEPKMYKQAYSTSSAVKALFASALIDYAINAIYIILMLVNPNGSAIVASRLASFAMVIPYWPIVSHWHPVFNVLTWDIVAVLMLSPFLLPTCQFLGYRQGPALWAKTEKAMADGKRRAKARSRIARKKKAPKVRGPEI